MLNQYVANNLYRVYQKVVNTSYKYQLPVWSTSRPFAYYRYVFFYNASEAQVLQQLRGKTIVDLGCGTTPYLADSMFQECRAAGIDFYGVDPIIKPDIKFRKRYRVMSKLAGGSTNFQANAPGLEKALSTLANDLPFKDGEIDLALSCWLMFVWLNDEDLLASIFDELYRVLKPGGTAMFYPMPEKSFINVSSPRLKKAMSRFEISQYHNKTNIALRVTPSFTTIFTRKSDL
jgi:SAM-dependent methyltransferase